MFYRAMQDISWLCVRIVASPGCSHGRGAACPYVGPRTLNTVGKFDNRFNFMRGIFSDNVDRLGRHSKSILIAHLPIMRHGVSMS